MDNEIKDKLLKRLANLTDNISGLITFQDSNADRFQSLLQVTGQDEAIKLLYESFVFFTYQHQVSLKKLIINISAKLKELEIDIHPFDNSPTIISTEFSSKKDKFNLSNHQINAMISQIASINNLLADLKKSKRINSYSLAFNLNNEDYICDFDSNLNFQNLINELVFISQYYQINCDEILGTFYVLEEKNNKSQLIIDSPNLQVNKAASYFRGDFLKFPFHAEIDNDIALAIKQTISSEEVRWAYGIGVNQFNWFAFNKKTSMDLIEQDIARLKFEIKMMFKITSHDFNHWLSNFKDEMTKRNLLSFKNTPFNYSYYSTTDDQYKFNEQRTQTLLNNSSTPLQNLTNFNLIDGFLARLNIDGQVITLTNVTSEAEIKWYFGLLLLNFESMTRRSDDSSFFDIALLTD